MLRFFINFLRDAIAYMYPRRKFRPVPRQIINHYKMGNHVTENERLIMLKNKARSPQAARQLMAKHKVDNAADLLEKLPKKRRRSFGSRFQQLLLKIDGHDPRDPYGTDRNVDNRL